MTSLVSLQATACAVCTVHARRRIDPASGINLRRWKTILDVGLDVTVTESETLVYAPLLEDRGRITESIRILVPVDRMKQKCFQITTKRDETRRRQKHERTRVASLLPVS